MAKKKVNKAAQTRKHRERLLSLYSSKSKEVKQRLTYKKVKKLDELAKKNHTSFKRQFELNLFKGRKRQVNYIAKKYKFDKEEANALLIQSIKENKSYKKTYEEKIPAELPEIFLGKTNWLAAVDALRAEKPDFKIIINFNIGEESYLFEGNPEEFSKVVPDIRGFLEDNEEALDVEYSVLEDILKIEYNNIIPDLATQARLSLNV